MGNSQQRYLTNTDAFEILGSKRWSTIKQKLETNGMKLIDFQLFANIIHSRFCKMNNELCESIFRAFSNDISGRVEVDSFISSLAVLASDNRPVIAKFLYRIYESSSGLMERGRVERLLKVANGNTWSNASKLDEIFRTAAGEVSTALNSKEFEMYAGSYEVLADWVVKVLQVFVEEPGGRLYALVRHYSSTLLEGSEDMQRRYDLDRASCEQLRVLFLGRCRHESAERSTRKPELSLQQWLTWVSERRFLSTPLATLLFRSRTVSFRSCWRFCDFVDFCVAHGTGNLNDQIGSLFDGCCVALRDNNTVPSGATSGMKRQFGALKSLICVLVFSAEDQPVTRVGEEMLESEDGGITVDDAAELTSQDAAALWSPALRGAVDDLSQRLEFMSHVQLRDAFVHLVETHYRELPGLRDLSLTACCLFGLQPVSTLLEKEFVTELTRRYVGATRQSRAEPFGHVGCEWALINKRWYDQWRVFVGNQQCDPVQRGSSQKSAPSRPKAIDNWSVLRKGGAQGQLLQEVRLNRDVVALPPVVFQALHFWYGGGPHIVRKVISSDSGGTEIELFLLCVRVVTCDNRGRSSSNFSQLLFSRATTVAEVTAQLCRSRRNVPVDQARLWNCANEDWRDQHVLSPGLTLREAGVLDGQTLLFEVALPSGGWPRSLLHASLETEDSRKDASTTVTVDDTTKIIVPTRGGGRASSKGLVGLDNLGNTCYLNSSLQALLHTEPLVDYFLSQAYLRDINVKNVHGFKGKLASSFGRLVSELYAKKSGDFLAPRAMLQTVASLRDQFAGNEQHDAQELLAFILDGLSEDLNLVHRKPYIEQPDSDDRPESELADIWWRNHLLRDHSIVQSLFTGQFQSVMRCRSCGYSSARYEPFTCLTVPIPEPAMRVLTVLVVPLQLQHATRVTVSVGRTACLSDVAEAVRQLRLTGTDCADQSAKFLVGEMSGMRVCKFTSLERKVATIGDHESIGLFQVHRFPVFRNEEHQEASIDEETTETSGSSGNSDTAPSVFEADKYKDCRWVRVSLTQRCAELVEGRFNGRAGYDVVSPEPIGVSTLEVLPEAISAADLYQYISCRMGPFLKGSVSSVVGHHDGDVLWLSNISGETGPAVDRAPSSRVESISTDEVMGGKIPSEGFTARLIGGGSSRDGACSKCHWLAGCKGCSIPNSADLVLNLVDGECIAVDWHVVVSEELLDSEAVALVADHPSVEKGRHKEAAVPLSHCLDKFTERERLDGVACPKCKAGDCVEKSFRIWRQPPVLIVQIKRFQFDRTSRSKLHTSVDFPLDGLDVSEYMARRPNSAEKSSSERAVSVADEVVPTVIRADGDRSGDSTDQDSPCVGDGGGEVDIIVPQVHLQSLVPVADKAVRTEEAASECTEYDLYSAIHHLGALGGGHYVTTARSLGRSDLSPSSGGSAEKWHLFNDHLVSEVSDTREITGPSAYVLFYMRRDVQGVDYDSLLGTERDAAPPTPSDGDIEPSSASNDVTAATTSVTAPQRTILNSLPRIGPSPQQHIPSRSDGRLAPRTINRHVLSAAAPPATEEESSCAVS